MKTHWRKNLDSWYISGEDLQNELNDLKREMVVIITHFEDVETFDQKKQTDVMKSGLYLADYKTGAKIHKPAVLNVSNARFLEKEFASSFVDDWLNKPVTLYAMPDKRHGFVARFKKYYAPQVSDVNALGVLSVATNLEQLTEFWGTLTAQEKKLPTVLALKDKLKTELTGVQL